MDSAPWIYELSFMWMLLVLSAYQSKHSHEQDLMEATQPQIGHKCPANPYTTSWDFPCSIFCPRPNKKKKFHARSYSACGYTLILPK